MKIIHCSYVYAGPQQAPTSLQSEFSLLSKHFPSSLPFLAEFALAWLHLRAAESKERRKEQKLFLNF